MRYMRCKEMKTKVAHGLERSCTGGKFQWVKKLRHMCIVAFSLHDNARIHSWNHPPSYPDKCVLREKKCRLARNVHAGSKRNRRQDTSRTVDGEEGKLLERDGKVASASAHTFTLDRLKAALVCTITMNSRFQVQLRCQKPPFK